MRPIGFSTGALAHGDFRRALGMLQGKAVPVLELSALRDHEVTELMSSLRRLELSGFSYVSVHAPSRFAKMSETEVVEVLRPCIEMGIPVIAHPDALRDPRAWAAFGHLLCIENMDNRKPTGRTADELEPFFEALPEAGFCFDVAHARQVDGTMIEARALLRRYGDRLRQVHFSEIDAAGRHFGLSILSVRAAQRIAHLIPESIPIVLESPVDAASIDRELQLAQEALSESRPSVRASSFTFAAID